MYSNFGIYVHHSHTVFSSLAPLHTLSITPTPSLSSSLLTPTHTLINHSFIPTALSFTLAPSLYHLTPSLYHLTPSLSHTHPLTLPPHPLTPSPSPPHSTTPLPHTLTLTHSVVIHLLTDISPARQVPGLFIRRLAPHINLQTYWHTVKRINAPA